MRKPRDIFKNASFLFAARIAQPAFTFVFIVIVARWGGAELLGGYDIVLSLLAVFQTIAAFGFKYLLTRETAEDADNSTKYFTHALIIAVPISLLCALLMTGLTFLLGYDALIQAATAVATFALLSTTMIECAEGVFIGIEKIRPYSLVIFFENLLRTLLGSWLIFSGRGLLELIILYALTRGIAVGVNLLVLSRLLPQRKFEFDFNFTLHLLKKAKPFALIMILASIYAKLDIIMLSWLKGATEVGLYSSVYRFIATSQILLATFGNTLYPHLSKSYQEDKDNFQNTCSEVIGKMIFMVAPFVIIIAFSAKFIVSWCFGNEFAASISVLQILILCLLPYALITIADFILLATHNQSLDLQINLYAVLCNAALNLTLIPRYGIIGAAIATLLSMLFYLGIQYFFIARRIITMDIYSIIKRPVASILPMSAFLLLCRDINLPLAILFSPAVYYLSDVFFNFFKKKIFSPT